MRTPASRPSSPPTAPPVPTWPRLLVLAGLVGFLLLAVLALTGAPAPAQAVDDAVTTWVTSHRRPWLTPLAWALTHLGGTTGLTALTLLSGAALTAWDRSHPSARPWWWRALLLGCAMVTSAAATTGLKILLGRPRPAHALLLGEPSASFAFPSGHSFNTAVWVGSLTVLLLVGRSRGRRSPLLLPLAALAVTVGVGLSRVYLAYHWTTDVLAGWCLGLAWVGAVAVVASRRHPRLGVDSVQPPAA